MNCPRMRNFLGEDIKLKPKIPLKQSDCDNVNSEKNDIFVIEKNNKEEDTNQEITKNYKFDGLPEDYQKEEISNKIEFKKEFVENELKTK